MDPSAFGILGTALSALVAALSYWAKTRHERRRATRAVLYYLLEVHHLVNRIHVSRKAFPSEYVAQCRRALASAGKVLSDDDSATLTQGVTLALNAFTANELQALATSIAEPFERALTELSREDPVLAFKLRGRDQLMMIFRKIEASIGGPEKSSYSGKSFEEEYAPLDDFLRGITVAELGRAVKATAWRCDVLTHVQVLLLLRRSTHEEATDNAKTFLKELVDDLVPQLVAAKDSPAPHALHKK